MNRLVIFFYYEYHNYSIGLFPEYEDLIRVLTRRYMTGEFSRAWWSVHKRNMPSAVADVVADELENFSGVIVDIQQDSELLKLLR